MELWEPVPIEGFENSYMISNLGRVKSLQRIKRQWNGYKYIEYEIPEKIRKPRISNGYYIVNLTVNGKRVQPWIHRLVAEAFIPNPNNLPEVDHKNGRKLDNRANNLRWVTTSQNQKYAQSRLKDLRKRKIEKQYGVQPILNTNKKCRVLNLETGKIFNTSRDADIWLFEITGKNGNDANIRRSCRSEGVKSCIGYHFRYIT